MAAPCFLPHLSTDILLLTKSESPADLLHRAHRRMETSLRKGLPPVASLRRYAHRPAPLGNGAWSVVDGHFIVVTELPARLAPNTTSFSIRYLDPWGGKSRTATISLPDGAAATTTGDPPAPNLPTPCLHAACPGAPVGTANARPGEASVLTLDAVLGRF